uniref:RNA-directed DNA polymerase, eukaryota n=1 Tax=Tanacetum cinerariifolium TaxID=118510 RepID=A0A699HGS0_TANCI|nr:RNA-directed DNA polymerase, eukaryota [Tanacetum cinerariifolium]
MVAPVDHSFRRTVQDGLEQQQMSDMITLLESVSLSTSQDRWICDLSGDGEFRVKVVRNLLDDMLLPSFSEPTRWVKCVPIKINIFAWRARQDCLPTRVNLVRRGVFLESTSCPLCESCEEDIHHIFFGVTWPRVSCVVYAVGGEGGELATLGDCVGEAFYDLGSDCGRGVVLFQTCFTMKKMKAFYKERSDVFRIKHGVGCLRFQKMFIRTKKEQLRLEEKEAIAKAKNINVDAQVHAKVDGKKVIIFEATIRRDLKFEDEGGVDCLSNEVIVTTYTHMVGLYARVESSVKEQYLGRINDEDIIDTDVYNDEEVVVEDINAASIATAVTVGATTAVSIDDITLAQALVEINTSKP